MRKPNDKELRLLEREPEVPAIEQPAAEEMDAAECRWDPWLLALASIEENESHAN